MPHDPTATLVAYGRDPYEGYWYFAQWRNNFSEVSANQLEEPNAFPAQATLSDSDHGRLIRIFYGIRYPISKRIRIDVLRPVRNETTGEMEFVGGPQIQTFEITWPALLETTYLLWFLSDVDGDGQKDLVAYTSQVNNILINVVVFPGRNNGTFGEPTVSSIELDPNLGNLMSAEFLKPLKTVQASYLYPGGDGTTSEAAILGFFDNYGVIGARIIAPKKSRGTLEYEFKGQNPSIAGQRSTTLGAQPGNFMGLDRLTAAVGLVKV